MILGIDASQANRKVRSGTEWYAFHLIDEFKTLLRDRSDVRVVLYLKDAPQADLVNNLPDNFSVKILRWPLKYFWGQIRLSWDILRNTPDVLFCPAHTIPISTSLLTSPHHLGRRRMRVFTTLHDIGFEDNPELYDKLSLWYHRWSAKFAVKHAYHIFTISEFSRQRIMEVYGCPEEKLSVTYLGVNPSAPSGHLPSPGERKNEYLLFVGRLEPKKNILNIVKAYEKFVSLRAQAKQSQGETEIASSQAPRNDIPDLILAGRKVRVADVEDYLSKRSELAKRVRFTGYISEGEKQQLYRDTAVFVFPTFYEGFGIPILEAQSFGVPVITSNRTANPEIAGEGALIVNPESVNDIAAAIGKLLGDQSLREEKIRLGLENVKRFSWGETAKLTLAKLMSSRTRSGNY
ncbi:MAG: glycosyltransferase family 4 protein [Candidatus Doudnabacteria bacterium]|nr:glycosyltransferase family 4 protein [Candidatus Doudnabacteria bacterium]